eukprot:1160985-Pelagomonas_calceolata.AAC.12
MGEALLGGIYPVAQELAHQHKASAHKDPMERAVFFDVLGYFMQLHGNRTCIGRDAQVLNSQPDLPLYFLPELTFVFDFAEKPCNFVVRHPPPWFITFLMDLLLTFRGVPSCCIVGVNKHQEWSSVAPFYLHYSRAPSCAALCLSDQQVKPLTFA